MNHYRDIADARPRVGNDFSTGMCPTTGPCPTLTPNGGECQIRPVGLDRKCVSPCKSQKIDTKICSQFMVVLFWVNPRVACSLDITKFKIGCDDLMTNCDAISAEFFACCDHNENMFTSCWTAANSEVCITFESKEEEDGEDVVIDAALLVATCRACPLTASY